MEWIKFFTAKWLYGSGRAMTAEKRGVWADLLALAGETKFRDGSLRFEVGQPMGRDYIANILRIERELLDTCLIAFQADVNVDDGTPRIVIWEDGTIFLTKFWEFQGVDTKGLKSKVSQKETKKDREAERQREHDDPNLILGQSIESVKAMLNGSDSRGKLVPERTKQLWRREAKRKGILL